MADEDFSPETWRELTVAARGINVLVEPPRSQLV